MKQVVLLAKQRSGTGALGSALDQHKNIKYFGEVFHHDAIHSSPNYFWHLKKKMNDDVDYSLPGNLDRKFQDYFEYLHKIEQSSIQIVDVKYSSLHHFNGYWQAPAAAPRIFELLAKNEIPVIHLRRENTLKVHVSGLLAEKNKVWHARELDTINYNTVRVDVNSLMNRLNVDSFQDNQIRSWVGRLKNVLTLEYDQTFSSEGTLTTDAVNEISSFLDVSDIDTLKPVFIKQVKKTISQTIENFDEVKGALLPTEYSWMLNS